MSPEAKGDTLATIALCWRVERRDGVCVALTDHDRDVIVGELVYRAAPGMVPSAVVRSEGLDADTMEVTGPLASAAFTAADLAAGRWDGARVIILAVDWSDPAAVATELGEGTIGEVRRGAAAFAAELRGAAARLEAPVTEATSPTCRAELGDCRCRVPMAGRRRVARVAAQNGATLTLHAGEPVPDAYAFGTLRWLGGAGCGLTRAIAASQGARVTLRGTAPVPDTPIGSLVELSEGCDRTLATCTARFGNAVNFRGEPFLPGMDLLTRYPGA